MGCWESQWLHEGYPRFPQAVLGLVIFPQLSHGGTLEAHGSPAEQFNVSSVDSHPPTVTPQRLKEAHCLLHTGFKSNRRRTTSICKIEMLFALAELCLPIVLNGSWCSVDTM